MSVNANPSPTTLDLMDDIDPDDTDLYTVSIAPNLNAPYPVSGALTFCKDAFYKLAASGDLTQHFRPNFLSS